jgi:hypothetical protein
VKRGSQARRNALMSSSSLPSSGRPRGSSSTGSQTWPRASSFSAGRCHNPATMPSGSHPKSTYSRQRATRSHAADRCVPGNASPRRCRSRETRPRRAWRAIPPRPRALPGWPPPWRTPRRSWCRPEWAVGQAVDSTGPTARRSEGRGGLFHSGQRSALAVGRAVNRPGDRCQGSLSSQCAPVTGVGKGGAGLPLQGQASLQGTRHVPMALRHADHTNALRLRPVRPGGIATSVEHVVCLDAVTGVANGHVPCDRPPVDPDAGA